MDKRYFLMIIIICICVFNLYMIVGVSDIVGSASVDVGDYTISLPEGFTMYDSNTNQVLLSNPTSKLDIQFFSSLGKRDTFEGKYDEINNDSKFKILSNGTINSGNFIVKSLFYQNVDNHMNYSTFYLNKDNHDFRMIVKGFNYDSQKNDVIKIVCDIFDSIRLNYKVQDKL